MPLGEERRGAVCGRTACTVRCGGGRKPRPVGKPARPRRLPPTLPRPGRRRRPHPSGSECGVFPYTDPSLGPAPSTGAPRPWHPRPHGGALPYALTGMALVSRASGYYNRMVVGMAETERADALFHALADPTRRDILAVVLCEA